ncbi:MAG TPA: Gfo/Idh/MocA family oxidoreductase [Terriglobia bacterium]|nr:Gfo/Idh/MocA family oxidoreductase [Terriglobia bacterium]
MAINNLTRRDFMRRSATGAAGLGYFLNGRWMPLEAAPPLMKPASPSDRVNIGFIGVGIRGHILTNAAIATGQANLVVACDTYQGHLDRSKETTDGKIDTCFCQYKSVLDRKDIDAVVIATPDHWHLPMALAALDAGKDVYIEKPMTHRIEDGPKIIAAARRHNRVVQVGSQGRSSALQKKAREIIASGQLGTVTKVVASYNRNSSTGAWNYPIPMDLKDGVNFNWKEWLGSAPSREFDPERVFRYRKYWDYSGGITTDLFVHLITSIHFIMDVKMPQSVVATGGILVRKDGREVPDTLDALFDYEGFHVNMSSTFNNASTAEQGMQFLGTEGSLVLGGNALSLTPEKHHEGYQYSIDSWPKEMQEQFWNIGSHRDEAKPTSKWEASSIEDKTDAVPVHMAEFFDCVRTRKECSENAQVGHYAASAGHMVNISYRSGKKVSWDAASGKAIV